MATTSRAPLGRLASRRRRRRRPYASLWSHTSCTKRSRSFGRDGRMFLSSALAAALGGESCPFDRRRSERKRKHPLAHHQLKSPRLHWRLQNRPQRWTKAQACVLNGNAIVLRWRGLEAAFFKHGSGRSSRTGDVTPEGRAEKFCERRPLLRRYSYFGRATHAHTAFVCSGHLGVAQSRLTPSDSWAPKAATVHPNRSPAPSCDRHRGTAPESPLTKQPRGTPPPRRPSRAGLR